GKVFVSAALRAAIKIRSPDFRQKKFGFHPTNTTMIFFNRRRVFLFLGLAVSFLLVFGIGVFVGQKQVVCPVCQPETIDFSLFWEAYYKLQKNFVDPAKLDTQKIIYGAISGMAKSLGDPYTSFFDPPEAKMFEQDLSGSFNGIGVEIGLRKNQITIIAPLKDTPGQRAGLKAGDIIVKIDEKNTFDMSIDEAVSLIRGKKGTEVTLTILRDDWENTKDIKIIRDTINIPSVDWELKEGNIAYIRIYLFDQSLSSKFNKVALEVLTSPAQKIVLDLRNNPGGYLEVSRDIAGWFLKKGQVVTIENFGQDKEEKYYKSEGSAKFSEYPIVVLINQGSASASEILAGALRDNRKIKLIGEKSFGKGSVQEVLDLRDGSILKVTIARWLTPNGNSISEVGLTPDIKVELTDKDFENQKDPQLDKALEIIKSQS
ncbi:MAG: S41 family peptidase, partial [Candidatus Staskawiczbacteria bacterium]|nr:S41 family peptidase [Candidatus Staskawiczbacteria bacterium]